MSRQATQSVAAHPSASQVPASAASPDAAGRSPYLDQSLDRAHKMAVAQGHATVTSEHLLFALTEDADALGVLGASTVNIERLRADIGTHLGQLATDGAGRQVMPAPDLLKVLKLAALAAQQSARRQIDGAIVLAAVIGDGSTPSAGLLRAHGLTFSEVIRVLQKNASQAAPAPTPVASPPPAATQPVSLPPRVPGPSTDDILSSVRTRLQEAAPQPIVRKPAPVAPVEAPAVITAPTPQQPAPTALPVAAEPVPPAPKADLAAPTTPRSSEQVSPSPAPIQSPTSAAPATPIAQPPSAPIASAPPALAENNSGTTTPPAVMPPQTVVASPAELKPVAPPVVAAAPAPVPPSTPPVLPSSMPSAAGGAPRLPPPLPTEKTASTAALPPLAPSPHELAVAREATRPPLPQAQPPQPQQPPRQFQAPPQPAPHVPPVALDMRALVNAVPRVVRNGQTEIVEVSVPRRMLEIPFAPGHRWPPLRVATLRLRAADGRAFVEAASPETLWIGPPRAHQGADDAVWRWRVTPRQNGGRLKLTLAGAARIVGSEGTSAEIPFGEESFEISIGRRRSRRGLVGLLLFGNLLVIGVLAMIMSGRAAEIGRGAWGAIRSLWGG